MEQAKPVGAAANALPGPAVLPAQASPAISSSPARAAVPGAAGEREEEALTRLVWPLQLRPRGDSRHPKRGPLLNDDGHATLVNRAREVHAWLSERR